MDTGRAPTSQMPMLSVRPGARAVWKPLWPSHSQVVPGELFQAPNAQVCTVSGQHQACHLMLEVMRLFAGSHR